jgi:hypothetical protein
MRFPQSKKVALLTLPLSSIEEERKPFTGH